jgi:hypothetical protein
MKAREYQKKKARNTSAQKVKENTFVHPREIKISSLCSKTRLRLDTIVNMSKRKTHLTRHSSLLRITLPNQKFSAPILAANLSPFTALVGCPPWDAAPALGANKGVLAPLLVKSGPPFFGLSVSGNG